MTEEMSLEEQLRELAERAKTPPDRFETTKTPVPSKDLESTLKEVSKHIILPAGKYIVDFDIIIKESGTLEIEPGAEFYFGEEAGIISYGTLKAIGTEEKKILFHAHSEHSSWRNIAIAGSSANDTVLEYCEVSYGAGRKVIPARDNFKGRYWKSTLGGGLLVAYSDPTIKHCKIYNNKAGFGGGLYLYKSDSTLEGNTIKGNMPKRNGGGLILVNSNPLLKDNIIEGNQADCGGGLYLHRSNPTLQGNTIKGNYAVSGGGFYIWNSIPTFEGNNITRNQANYGGGLFLDEADLFLEGNITANLASVGGGVYHYKSDPIIPKEINISDNSPDNISNKNNDIYPSLVKKRET